MLKIGIIPGVFKDETVYWNNEGSWEVIRDDCFQTKAGKAHTRAAAIKTAEKKWKNFKKEEKK